MDNKVTNWGWGKPTTEGLYLVCLGDVEVAENIELVNFRMVDGELVDHAYDSVNEYNSSCKFAKLNFKED